MALQKLPKNKGDLGKLIVTKSFKKLPKVQKIAQYGHIGCCQTLYCVELGFTTTEGNEELKVCT